VKELNGWQLHFTKIQAKEPAPRKFERDANCAQDAPRGSGGTRQIQKERGYDGDQVLVVGAVWDLRHRQECLCY